MTSLRIVIEGELLEEVDYHDLNDLLDKFPDIEDLLDKIRINSWYIDEVWES